MLAPIASWYSRRSVITSSGSALSEKPVNPRQVTEERGNLPSMALQLLLAPRRNDQISHLLRQEAPQTAHAFDFAYLVGDTLFELLIQASLTSSVRSHSSFKKSRVFDSDYSLRSKVRPPAQSAYQ